MIDVKKLVVAFLVLAVLASVSALALLGSGNGGQATSSNAQAAFTAENTANISSPYTNAFASSSAGEENGALGSGLTDASATSSDNLTNQLTDLYASDLIASNPNGPQTDANGNQTLAVPTAESVLSDLASSSAYQNIKVPDWDFEAALQTIRTATDTSPAAVARYSDALSNIVNQYIIKTGLQGMVSDPNSATLDNVSSAASELNGALNDVAALTVPENLADFQKSLVKVMTYEKNTLALAENASADPVKTAFIYQAEEPKYLAALQEFQNSWQSAEQNKTFSFASPEVPRAPANGAVSFLENMIGIPTAHAQYLVFDATTFAQMLKEWVEKTLLQILINDIILLLQSKVLAFVRNSGNPYFIRAWYSFLGNAFNVAAGSALGQIMPTLCSGFSTNVGGWLKNTFNSAKITSGGVSLNGSPGTNCTLQNSVSNLPAFYNNFNAGGFKGFTALLSPNNNPYGAFMESYDSILTVSAAQQKALEDQAIASNGYKGQAKCSNGQQPSANGTCTGGTIEPLVSTPGVTLKDLTSGHLGSDVHLVVNANAIVGLLTTIAQDFLNKIILSGSGITGGGVIGGSTGTGGLGASCTSSSDCISGAGLVCGQSSGGPCVCTNSGSGITACSGTISGGNYNLGLPTGYSCTQNADCQSGSCSGATLGLGGVCN
jgi:hypothetical protein